MLRTMDSQVASIQQGVNRITGHDWPVTYSTRNMDTAREINVRGGTYSSTDNSKEALNPKAP